MTATIIGPVTIITGDVSGIMRLEGVGFVATAFRLR